MILRILKGTTASRNPAHVPNPVEEHAQQIRDLARAEIMHILDVFDPDDIDVRRWLLARRLPINHREAAVWALLAQTYDRLQALEHKGARAA